MDWNYWKGKRIFIKTKSNRFYSGKCVSVDFNEDDLSIIFITIIDKFNQRVVFATSEIVKIAEEDKNKKINQEVKND